MGEKIKIGEIKKALEHNRHLATEPSERYGRKEEQWGVYDSSIEDFGKTFNACLPTDYKIDLNVLSTSFHAFNAESGENFKNYIEKILSADGKGHLLTAVEFGGPGSELFRGFTKNFFRKTVGICLKDIRNKGRKDVDKENGHSIIVGDITEVLNDRLIIEVAETLGTTKTDLVISKIGGPLFNIKSNPAILDRIFRNWYDMLNVNGLMFIEYIEYKNNEGNLTLDEISKWSNVVREKFPEIDIQVNIQTRRLTMRVHKKDGAREKLPPATRLFI